jgi:DNA polymerase-3 subunit epsilon
MDRLIVVDVETANESTSSICQIGIVVFENGKVIDSWDTLINPQDEFSWMNIAIHGITEQDVASAPLITDVLPKLKQYFDDNTVLTYGHFDRIAFNSALPESFNKTEWFDITRVVRRTWKQYAYKGYNLKNIAKYLNIPLPEHHNAKFDALVAGKIMLTAIKETGLKLSEWKQRINQSIFFEETKQRIADTEVNPNGCLFGEVIIFTGSFDLNRSEITILAKQNGAQVRANFSNSATMLVCGLQTSPITKNGLSTKERKTKELLENGHQITILAEKDFMNLIKANLNP